MRSKAGVLLLAAAFVSCHVKNVDDTAVESPTLVQQQMLDEGWTFVSPREDLTKDYGIEPAYGIQDNYFDIAIGKGCSVAIKIMDLQTNRCIRYVYVAEDSEITVHEIPQGQYYLKLAYGSDWMEMDANGGKLGKFTKSVSYAKSTDLFDFGIKNSSEVANYRLEINIVDSQLEYNFTSTPISEEEFMK